MLKLTYCLHRLPHLSREEFQRYWREQHAPLVTSYRNALAIRRYVQSHALTTDLNDGLRTSRGLAGMYDGVAELWWDSADALARAMATPEGRSAGRALIEDERKFIDFTRSVAWFGEEMEIFA